MQDSEGPATRALQRIVIHTDPPLELRWRREFQSGYMETTAWGATDDRISLEGVEAGLLKRLGVLVGAHRVTCWLIDGGRCEGTVSSPQVNISTDAVLGGDNYAVFEFEAPPTCT